jgi:hypothetical protein
MLEKILFVSLLTSSALAAEVNPCGNRAGNYFARNPRGCSWYFVCENSQVVRENRCERGFRFNYDRQMCDYIDQVYCDIDDRLRNVTCPNENGINIIPHPQTCLKYTGDNLSNHC